MDINNSLPWIWLGFDDIYVRKPGLSTWEILSQDEVSWAARVSGSGGQEILRQPGQKLGWHEAGLELDKVVLKQLLEYVGEPAVLFAPPRQTQVLQRVAQEMDWPPQAISLDSRLMVNQETVSIRSRQRNSETDIYVFDWTRLAVIRQFFKDQPSLFDACPFPVLMTAKAYVEGKMEILAYYQGGLGASTAILEAPQQSHQERREVGLGLVWAWGFGLRMWQWALKPVALPSGDRWIFECVPPNICRVSVGDKHYEWTLLEPVMEVGFF